MASIQSINPATEQVSKTYNLMQEKEVGQIIQAMGQAQQDWALTDNQLRKNTMLNLARLLREDKQNLATLITKEMGKPISQSLAEVEKCANLCHFYAQESAGLLEPEYIQTEHYRSYRSFQALGIVFGIMPWNFPLWQVMRFAVPNLMAGNAALLKHAPNCPGVALAIEALFHKAGFPKPLFRSLIIDLDLVPFIIHHPFIAGVTLTGSNRAGQSVAKEAGSALKKVILELGGSDPYLILEDANLDFAAEQCVLARLNNCGQVCIAPKRLIAVKKVYKEFEALVLEKAKAYHYGDPMDPKTILGPMARNDLRLQLHQQVKASIASGAICALGGELPTSSGYFYPATVLLQVNSDSPAFKEELFGPVLCITEARNEAHAIELANQTPYGLGAAVFTADIERGERIAREGLQAGSCRVNGFVASDPRLPFGGIKQSGFGRELSTEGLREFLNIKTVVVDKPADIPC